MAVPLAVEYCTPPPCSMTGAAQVAWNAFFFAFGCDIAASPASHVQRTPEGAECRKAAFCADVLREGGQGALRVALLRKV